MSKILADRISEGLIHDNEETLPKIFCLKLNKDREELRALLDARPSVRVVDHYEEIIKELLIIENPPLRGDPDQLNKAFRERITTNSRPDGDVEDCGIWIYYSWSQVLLHLPEENDYYRLRTARNHELVTIEEQDILKSARIGIIGLSVGQASALTLTISGIGKNLKLADPDTIDASNLNRIHAGAADIGTAKTTLLARRITEIDPFARPEIFSQKITKENIDNFLVKNSKLQIIIDAFDDVKMKVELRRAARRHGVAVLMATDVGDGAVLEIERYDLDSQTPMFGGRISESNLNNIPERPTINQMGQIAMAMIGLTHPPERMIKSIQGLGRHLSGYPQLALASFLCGSLTTYAAKKIALGDPDIPKRISILLEDLKK